MVQRYNAIYFNRINEYRRIHSKHIKGNNISTEGVVGTVGGEEFEDWVRDYLLPVLGNYERNEANLVLVLDNASTHNSERVLQMIRAKGTYIIFTAPYSADLNPIELGFNIYKSHLKKKYKSV